MTDWLLSLVPVYGLWLIGGATFLSCLAMPIPASVVMLAAGGFVGAGDLVLWQVLAAAFAGAMAGDQLGFAVGRRGGVPLLARASQTPARGKLIGNARHLMNRRGGIAVFLSRWLFSPLGPYVNLVSGAIGLGWGAFTFWGALGEAVWCAVYVLTGMAFAGNLSAAADMLGSVLGLIASGAATLGLGWLLLHHARRDRRRGPPDDPHAVH